jgi:hypothetical protein
MMNEDYRSAAMRSHYRDRRSQAFAFLQTIASKALVLQEQRQHLSLDQSIFTDSSLSLSTMTDEFRTSGSPMPSVHLSGLPPVDELATTTTTSRAASNHDSLRSDITGLNEEAESRQRIIQQERLRAIRRKILEKNAISVYKRGRNHKMRLIDIIVQHEKKKETYIMWKSKMNTLKKVEIDHNTHVEVLPHETLHEEGFEHNGPPIQGHSPAQSRHLHHHHYHGAVHHKHRHHANHTSNSSVGSTNSGSVVADDGRMSSASGAQTPMSHLGLPPFQSRRSRVDSQDSSSTSRSDFDSLAGNSSQLKDSTNSQTAAQRILLQADSVDGRINVNNQESGNFSSHSITSLSSSMSYSKTSTQYHNYIGIQHHRHASKPVPFLRLKNRSRYLDLQFLSHVELEAFLMVIQRYANLQMKFDPNLLTLTGSVIPSQVPADGESTPSAVS